MTTCVLFVALASLAQTSKLELTNVRATHGGFGPARPDLKLPLGDVLFLGFDVVGLQADAAGRMRFQTRLEVLDGKGKVVYQPEPAETLTVDVANAGRARHFVHLVTGLDQTPDTLKLRVVVLDQVGKREATLSRDVTILPLEFSLVRLQFSYDKDNLSPASAVGVVGQILYVNFLAIGFQRDKKKDDQANVGVELTLLDDKDKPLTTKPLTGEFRDIPPDVKFLPLRFDLPLQRAGQFKVQLKAFDALAKKSVTLVLPLQVVDLR